MNAVIDTSVYISSLLQKQGVPAQVIDAWRAQLFEIVTSPAIVEEVRCTMARSRIRRKYNLTNEQIGKFIYLLLTDTIVVPGTAEVGDANLRDPKDEIILACVVDSSADVLVTSDKDLLVLGRYRGVPIVTPRQFVDEYLPRLRSQDRGG